MKKKTNISDAITQIQQLITEFKQLKQNKTFDDIYIYVESFEVCKSLETFITANRNLIIGDKKKLPM